MLEKTRHEIAEYLLECPGQRDVLLRAQREGEKDEESEEAGAGTMCHREGPGSEAAGHAGTGSEMAAASQATSSS